MSQYPDPDEQILVGSNQPDFVMTHDISNLMSIVLLLIIIFPEEFCESVGYI
jgi:hypothetical protein